MRESAGDEANVAIGEFRGHRRLAYDVVGDFGISERDGDVVVTMQVSLGLGVGIDLDVEDADVLVFKGQVMVRLVGDFDFGGDLGAEKSGQ